MHLLMATIEATGAIITETEKEKNEASIASFVSFLYSFSKSIMRQLSSSLSLRRLLAFLCLFLGTTTTMLVAASKDVDEQRQIPPFFNKHAPGYSHSSQQQVDAQGNVQSLHQKIKDLKHAATQVFKRRHLATGNHPNLPGGGAAVGGGGGAYDGGGVSGGGGGEGPPAGGGEGGGQGPPAGGGEGGGEGPPTGGGAGGAEGGPASGKGFIGKGSKAVGESNGGKGKGGLSKKGSKKSSKSSKSYGGSGGTSAPGYPDDDDVYTTTPPGDDDDDMEPIDDDHYYPSVPSPPCTCNYTVCDCPGGGGGIASDYEFVLVRDEIGSDTPGADAFGVASGIGLNGHVYNMVYTTYGRDFGGDPIGLFKGFCTVVSDINGELLCNYEIYIYANGPAGVGGVIVTGPVAGLETGKEFQSIVTGAEFDFSQFNTGFLTTVQDPQKPILYSFLSLMK